MNSRTYVNLLLIGGTGTGKSFFINAFERLVVHESLDDAAKHLKDFAAPVVFCYNDVQIRESATKDECFDQSNSAGSQTSRPVVYEYQSDQCYIRLIDTPGIGDTRGEDLDENRMAHIVSCLHKFDKIHGILLFFKQSDNRFGKTYKKDLLKLLSFLGKTAMGSVQVIMTHSDPHYELTEAPSVIKDLNRCLLVNIPNRAENTFFFQNAFIKYLISKKHNIGSFTARSLKAFADEYEEGARECHRMITNICHHTTPYDVGQYRTLALARQLRANLRMVFINAQNRDELQEIEREMACVEQLNKDKLRLEKTLENVNTYFGRFRNYMRGSTNQSLQDRPVNRENVTRIRYTSKPRQIIQYAAAVRGVVLGFAAAAAVVGTMIVSDYRNTNSRRAELRGEIQRKVEQINEHLTTVERLEARLREKEDLCQLEKDVDRFMFDDAILASESSLESEIQITAPLSWELLNNRINGLLTLPTYGAKISSALDACKRENEIDFERVIRMNFAFSTKFGKIYARS